MVKDTFRSVVAHEVLKNFSEDDEEAVRKRLLFFKRARNLVQMNSTSAIVLVFKLAPN